MIYNNNFLQLISAGIKTNSLEVSNGSFQICKFSIKMKQMVKILINDIPYISLLISLGHTHFVWTQCSLD